MKWAKDAQGIKWVGEAQDAMGTNPVRILGNVNQGKE